MCLIVKDELNRIVGQLEDAAAALNDLSMAILHEAIEAGQGERPAIEKRVSQARRAVEKAIHHLASDSESVNGD